MKHVKNSQGVQLARLARDYNVPREQFSEFLKDPKRLKEFFNEIKGINPWFEKLQKEAEKMGATLHLIEELPVNYGRPHNEAAMAGGPQTPSSYDVLKVADKYRAQPETVTETIILLNHFKGGGNYQKIVEWGLQNGLRRTTPHVAFTIGERFPKLNYELGPNPMYVVETTGCSWSGYLDACYMWWDDANRRADLNWRSSFGNDRDWFAFRK